MFAINHAAAALILKRRYEEVPIVWALLAVQFMELLWVVFNLVGLERTTTEAVVRTVGDVHLAHMPYSHSAATMLGAAALAWLTARALGRPALGAVLGLGIASHFVLDLATHSADLALAPGVGGPMLGLGLYATAPLTAFLLELGFGAACWRIYRGGMPLLGVIVLFNLANLSMFSAAVPGPEGLMAGRPLLIVAVIGVQIAVTLLLVGVLSRRPAAAMAPTPAREAAGAGG